MARVNKGLFYKRMTHQSVLGYDYQMALPNLFSSGFDASLDTLCGYIMRTYRSVSNAKPSRYRKIRFGVSSTLSSDNVLNLNTIDAPNLTSFKDMFDMDIYLDVDPKCIENGMLSESSRYLQEAGFSRIYVNVNFGMVVLPNRILNLCEGVRLSNVFFEETFSNDRFFLTDCLVYLCKKHRGLIVVDGVNSHQQYAFLSNFPVSMTGSYFF